MRTIEKVEVAAPTLFDANHEDYVQVLNATKVAQISETQKFSPENVEVLEKLEAVKTTATMPRITRDEQPTGEAFQSGFLAGTPTAQAHLPIYPLSMEVQSYIRAVAQTYRVDRDFATTAVYAAVSAAVGEKWKIRCAQFDNTASVWLMQVRWSGGGKSPCMGEVMEPIKKIQKHLHDEYMKAKDQWEAAPKESKERKPVEHGLLLQDTTPECLGVQLNSNPTGMMLFRPELGGWLGDFGRYDRSGELEMYLQLWGGEDIQVSRLSRDSIYVKSPYFSVFGGVQNDRISKIFNYNMLSSGFVARILFCWPEFATPTEFKDIRMPLGHRKFWAQTINKLYEDKTERIFDVTPEALNIYGKYWESVQSRLDEEGVADANVRSMLSKLEIYVLKWALLTFVLSEDVAETNYTFMGNDLKQMKIGADVMRSAVDSMSLFEQWGRKVYDALRTPDSLVTAPQAIRALQRIYGVNQSKLAEAIGKDQSYINKVIRGKK